MSRSRQLLLARLQGGAGQRRGGVRARPVPPEGDPVEELYDRAGSVLRETGAVPAELLAAVIKMELASVREQAGSGHCPVTNVHLIETPFLHNKIDINVTAQYPRIIYT